MRMHLLGAGRGGGRRAREGGRDERRAGKAVLRRAPLLGRRLSRVRLESALQILLACLVDEQLDGGVRDDRGGSEGRGAIGQLDAVKEEDLSTSVRLGVRCVEKGEIG